jgi:hypothetical protein
LGTFGWRKRKKWLTSSQVDWLKRKILHLLNNPSQSWKS